MSEQEATGLDSLKEVPLLVRHKHNAGARTFVSVSNCVYEKLKGLDRPLNDADIARAKKQCKAKAPLTGSCGCQNTQVRELAYRVSTLRARLIALRADWDESKVNRQPGGSEHGGEFAPKGEGGGGGGNLDTKPKKELSPEEIEKRKKTAERIRKYRETGREDAKELLKIEREKLEEVEEEPEPDEGDEEPEPEPEPEDDGDDEPEPEPEPEDDGDDEPDPEPEPEPEPTEPTKKYTAEEALALKGNPATFTNSEASQMYHNLQDARLSLRKQLIDTYREIGMETDEDGTPWEEVRDYALETARFSISRRTDPEARKNYNGKETDELADALTRVRQRIEQFDPEKMRLIKLHEQGRDPEKRKPIDITFSNGKTYTIDDPNMAEFIRDNPHAQEALKEDSPWLSDDDDVTIWRAVNGRLQECGYRDFSQFDYKTKKPDRIPESTKLRSYESEKAAASKHIAKPLIALFDKRSAGEMDNDDRVLWHEVEKVVSKTTREYVDAVKDILPELSDTISKLPDEDVLELYKKYKPDSKYLFSADESGELTMEGLQHKMYDKRTVIEHLRETLSYSDKGTYIPGDLLKVVMKNPEHFTHLHPKAAELGKAADAADETINAHARMAIASATAFYRKTDLREVISMEGMDKYGVGSDGRFDYVCTSASKGFVDWLAVGMNEYDDRHFHELSNDVIIKYDRDDMLKHASALKYSVRSDYDDGSIANLGDALTSVWGGQQEMQIPTGTPTDAIKYSVVILSGVDDTYKYRYKTRQRMETMLKKHNVNYEFVKPSKYDLEREGYNAEVAKARRSALTQRNKMVRALGGTPEKGREWA